MRAHAHAGLAFTLAVSLGLAALGPAAPSGVLAQAVPAAALDGFTRHESEAQRRL